MCGIQKSSKIPDRSVHEVGLVDGPYLFPTQPTASMPSIVALLRLETTMGSKAFLFALNEPLTYRAAPSHPFRIPRNLLQPPVSLGQFLRAW